MFFAKTKRWDNYLHFFHPTDIENVKKQAQERLTFFGIRQETLLHIKQAGEIIGPHFEEMIDFFFACITKVDRFQHIINKYTTLEKLKQELHRYLVEFFRGEFDDQYISARMAIGNVASRVHLNADHFISVHQLLMQMITSMLMEKLHKKPDEMMKCVTAVQKLAAYDQQLVIQIYNENTFKVSVYGISDMLNQVTQLDMSRKLLQAVDHQKEETHSVTAATEEMSASIAEVANHAVTVSEGTDDAVQAAERSKEVIDTALVDIKKVGKVYEEVEGKVQQLNEEIEHTQSVVNIVKEISDQTNLLALNASIEAARAGEHGKGFAVVASEVRKLSEHTQEQITQITKNMETLLQVSGEVTTKIEQTGSLVEKSVSAANIAGDELTKIVSTIQEINGEISEIAAMSEEQTSSITEISDRNNVIFELSTESEHLSKRTAKIIFELSNLLESFYSNLFSMNIHLNAKDVLRLSITDHLLWKWKIFNVILGISKMDVDEITSYKNCRFGKWYYGSLPDFIKNHPAYAQLEDPHIEVHELAKQAVDYYQRGEEQDALLAFEGLQERSKEVVSLLEELLSSVK